MRRIIAAGSTDVGRVRESNEDALLLRDSVFAVADGMGGHLAGEVASATALVPIEELDGKVFPDATTAATALRDAVVAANDIVAELAEREPSYRGMGTTLTAALLEGRRLHVAHVGDSRAYLLRDGQFSQLTDDHTLVQHLIDEGQLTKEEAEQHPKRSIITRAIGVSREIDVDSMSLDLVPGDQLLLCSDGLTGVVADRSIAETLLAHDDPDVAVARLIELANEAGGPDNVTVVLLRYEDPDAEARAITRTGEASVPHTIAIRTRDDRTEPDWARQLGSYGPATGDGPFTAKGDTAPPRAGRILGRAAAIVLALALLVALVGGGGRFLLSRSYFVGLEGDRVVIYQGIDASLGPIDLARIVERTDVTVDDIPNWYVPTLEAGRPAADLNDARRLVANVPRRDAPDPADDGRDDDGAEEPEDEPDDDPGAGDGAP